MFGYGPLVCAVCATLGDREKKNFVHFFFRSSVVVEFRLSALVAVAVVGCWSLPGGKFG